MKNMKYFLIINVLLNIVFPQKKYEHYDYDEIFSIFEDLSHSCSHYLKIDTSQSRYNLDSIDGCGKNKNCKNLIVFLTDFDSYTLERPTYYISGTLHGDEMIGPTSVTEFVKYFCDSYNSKKNSLYHNILKNKLIIITPMTNAYGYYNKNREEKVFLPNKNEYRYVDPNRDFPYYNSKKEIQNCMETLSARTINEIFNEFIIEGGITFHAGTSVLGYPWGNFVHINKKVTPYKSTESPDNKAFYDIGKAMVTFSSSRDNIKNEIRDYELGDMTSTVYALDGALEDWAYGGWENKEYENNGIDLRPIKTCKPKSFNSYDMIWNNNNNLNSTIIDYEYKLRCLMYLAEASDIKKPKDELYGINNFSIDNNGDIFDFYKTTNFYGLIPRNMRLMYTGIDLISASIYFNIEKIQLIKDTSQLIIPFLFMGCLSLKKYSIYRIPFEGLTREKLEKKYLELNANEQNIISEINDNIKCYYNNLTYYNLIIDIQNNNNGNKKHNLRNLQEDKNKDPMHYFERPGGNYDYLGNVLGVKFKNGSLGGYIPPKKGFIYLIKGEAPDEDWAFQENPDPKVGPQSHVVRSKIKSNYFINNGNYSLKSNYFFYSYPVVAYESGEAQIIDDIDSFFYSKPLNYLKLIVNSDDDNYNIYSQFYIHKKKREKNDEKNEKYENNNLYYLSSENTFKIDLQIIIYEEKEKEKYLIKLLKNIKKIELFSQILLNDENENYHLKPLECEYHGGNSLFINCDNILKDAKGKDIRQKLLNSILVFEIRYEKNTILNVFGQVTLENNNKGKYYVDFYSNKEFKENNKMVCTSNYPLFINNLKNKTNNEDNNYLGKDIFYVMNISKISTTKLLVNIDIKQKKNSYNYFLIFFPYYDKIEIFDIKKKIFEVEINLDENANGKIIGKTVFIIPIEDEDYEKSSDIIFKTNDYMSLIDSINNISKNKNYDVIPCSIFSYNSIINENSTFEFRKMLDKLNDKKLFKKKDYGERFIFKHFFISCIFLSCFLILIFYLLIKKYRKKSKLYSQFDDVIIANTPQNSRADIH